MSSALLKLQIGPVQDFIAQARSTRDLWSGSYLLSWLMAAGATRLLQEAARHSGKKPSACRDVVVYPDLSAQPLITRWLQVEAQESIADGTDNNAVLTPNLPNLFVAKLDLDVAAVSRIARDVEATVRDEWQAIAAACWAKSHQDLGPQALSNQAKSRFDSQVARFLTVSWQVSPWENSSSYSDAYSLNGWALDAVRQTRDFKAWRAGGWDVGLNMNKDTLTGREEMLLGGTEWWERHGERLRGLWSVLLRRKHEGDLLGAITLIKRTWHWAYLNDKKWDLKPLHISEASRWKTQFPFPSTFDIAQHNPTKRETDDTREPDEDSDRLDRYFAVLAFDGDQIGKWIGGAFHALDEPFHRDFSRRLGNFALQCVRPIVVACDGRLIYAGGDDVLALLPADTVLECAQLLRQAYRGDPAFIAPMTSLAARLLVQHQCASKSLPDGNCEEISPLLVAAATGGLFDELQGRVAMKGQPKALDLPGEIIWRNEKGQEIRPDASVGIAVAHFKDPFQDVIREAQSSEKRAKQQYGRSAVAVTLLKRSGETTAWGTQWDSPGLAIYRRMAEALAQRQVSNRFPYSVVELLQSYLTETTPISAKALERVPNFDAVSVIECELSHVIDRQSASAEARVVLRKEWLDPNCDQSHPNQIHLFLHWAGEQEARAAARRLAENLAPSADCQSGLAEIQALLDLADAIISNDSANQQQFRVLAGKSSKTRSENDPIRKAANTALESFEMRVPENQIQAVIGLCQTVAFIDRNRDESAPSPSALFAQSVVSAAQAERHSA